MRETSTNGRDRKGSEPRLRLGRVRVPWYRWRFSLPLLLCIGLFGWLTWVSLTEDGFPLSARLRIAAICAALAAVFAWFQWRDRYPLRSEATRREREQEPRQP